MLPIDAMARMTTTYNIGIAIITVPKDAAQKVSDHVVSLGINAIWNFAPARLEVPPHVVVRSENLAIGAALLSHYLKQSKHEIE